MSAGIVFAVFGLVFLAELGDKTQLIVLALAARTRARTVLAGAFSAFFLLDLAAVAAGAAVYRWLPLRPLQLAAGGLMALFGALSILGKAGGPGEERAGGGSFIKVLGLVMLMELGDKTQLTLMALAASHGEPASVFVGGTLALWTSTLLAVALGGRLARRVPAGAVHKVSGAVFLVFGLAMIMDLA